MQAEGKIILVIMPKNQFCEQELFTVLKVLKTAGARTVVLSKSGREAAGMNRQRFQPNGMIVDWDKQEGITGKYDAVLLTGGKGAQKSLWDDPIIPQILTDHYRAEKIVGALGSALVVPARSSLLTGDVASPDTEAAVRELEDLGIGCVDQSVTDFNGIVTGSGGEAAETFANRVVELLSQTSD